MERGIPFQAGAEASTELRKSPIPERSRRMTDPMVPAPAPDLPAPDCPGNRCNRRGALAALGTGVAGVVAGAAFGYKFRFRIDDLRASPAPPPAAPESTSGDDRAIFQSRALEIMERHRLQTADNVAALKEKY